MTDAQPTPSRKRRATRFFLAGVATLLPTVLTGYIVFVCYRFVHTNVGGWIAVPLAKALGQWDPVRQQITNPYTVAAGDILAVVFVLGVAIVVGAMAASFIGRRVIRGAEQLLLKVPFIKVIYPYVKQVTDFILSEKKVAFRKVVAVPYPRKGLYSLGFVTGQGWRSIREATGEDMVQVFIPSSPTPVTGYVVFVRREEIIELPITVDQALRFSISAGVIVPPRELVEAAAADAEEREAPAEPKRPAWATDE